MCGRRRSTPQLGGCCSGSPERRIHHARICTRERLVGNKIVHWSVLRRQGGLAEIVAEMLHENGIDANPGRKTHQIGQLMEVLAHHDDHHPDLRQVTGMSPLHFDKTFECSVTFCQFERTRIRS